MATKSKARASAYQVLTDRILELLEAGTVPWRKPWHTGGGMPRSLNTGKAYRGINVFMLGCQSYASPWWTTYVQAKALGGHGKKGEKSTAIIKWHFPADDGDDSGDDSETKRRPWCKVYRVFNVEQCEGIPADKIPSTDGFTLIDHDPIQAAEKLIAASPCKPTIQHGQGGAWYRPASDTLGMPDRNRFDTAEEYYSTYFHELTHATGHKSRLNREGIAELAAFGSHSYTREEFIAEMGAAFLQGACGIVDSTLDNSAAYIDGWRRRISKDAKLVMQAAAAAQKAADYIQGASIGAKELEPVAA